MRIDLIRWIFFGLNKEEQQLLDGIKESGAYKTIKVTKHGTVSKDPEEILNSPKYQELSRKAEQMVNGND